MSSDTVGRIPGVQFLNGTIEALQLVERVDLRRFKRIQKEIRFIVHAELPQLGANYRRWGKFCVVDYGRYDFSKNHDWYLQAYAATLVHEATHGLIYTRHIASTARNRIRIERLCHSEERRFLRRLDTPDRPWSDQIISSFDEAFYSQYYGGSFLTRLLWLLRRFAEVRKRV